MHPLPFSSPYPFLETHTLYLVRHGSRAFGTALETSDEDFKGFAIPPREVLFGFVGRFEQADLHHPDAVIYDIRKFLTLAAACNPAIIEVLWVEPEDVIRCHPLAERLLEKRQCLLSRKAAFTFTGYAMGQLKRIRQHRRWLEAPLTAPPARAEFGLPERTLIPADQLAAAMAAIRKKLDSWEWKHLENVEPATRLALMGSMAEVLAEMHLCSDPASRMAAAGRSLGYDDNFIELLERERQYSSRKADWDNFLTWKKERNPARAALEAKHGYDTKHAMHLVRLMRMGQEILGTGRVIVRRPDREELLAIRQGAWSYEALLSWAEAQEAAFQDSLESSVLPHQPETAILDALCVELIERWTLGAGSTEELSLRQSADQAGCCSEL